MTQYIEERLELLESIIKNGPVNVSFNNCTFNAPINSPLISDFSVNSTDMSQNKDNSIKNKPKTQEFKIDGNVGQFGNETNAFDGNVGQLSNASNGFAGNADATTNSAKDNATTTSAKDNAEISSASHLSDNATASAKDNARISSASHFSDAAVSNGDDNQVGRTINIGQNDDSVRDSILVPQETYEDILLDLPHTNLATNKEYFIGRLLNYFTTNLRNAYLTSVVSKFAGTTVFKDRLTKIQEFGQTFIKKIPLNNIFKVCQPELLHLLDDYRTRELIFRFLNNDCSFDKLKEIVTVSEKEHFGKYFEILQKVYASMTITKKLKDIFCKLEKVTKENYASRANEDVIRLFFLIFSDSFNGYNNTSLFLSRDTMHEVFKDNAEYSVEFKQVEYPSHKINELLLCSPDYKEEFARVEYECNSVEKDKYDSIYCKLFTLTGDDDDVVDEYLVHKSLDDSITDEAAIINSIEHQLHVDCSRLLDCAEPIEIVVRAWFLAAFMHHTIENDGTKCNQVYTFTTNS